MSRYDEEGYEVFPGLILEEVDAIQDAVAVACQRFRDGDEDLRQYGVAVAEHTRQQPERNPGILPEDAGDEAHFLYNLAAISVEFRRFIAAERLWSIAAQCLKVDVEEVVYRFGRIVRKPARVGPDIYFHRDFADHLVSNEGMRYLRLLIPVQQMSADNGGTEVVPRSHLITDEEAFEAKKHIQSRAGAVCPSVKPGDVLALHCKTLHGGAPNRSDRDRDLIVLQFGDGNAPRLRESEWESMTQLYRSEMLAALASQGEA